MFDPSLRPRSADIRWARQRVVEWFASRGWKPFRFQRQVWNAYLAGDSGLVHATTGTGKTYAVWMAALIETLAELHNRPAGTGRPASRQTGRGGRAATHPIHERPLRVLWITPLRALAVDTLYALQRPLQELDVPWTLESRTGDTSAAVRNRQRKRLPTSLVTTPESLSLMLTRSDAQHQFRDLRLVVVDEWHELLSTKRGVQVELALARLRKWRPTLRTWGLSATLGNLQVAMQTLLGVHRTSASGPQAVHPWADQAGGSGTVCVSADPECSAAHQPGSERLIEGTRRKRVIVDTLIPRTIERFPWAGHMGLRLLRDVVETVDAAETSLVFANTRFQTEAWYQALLQQRPDWAGRIALHHGSLSQSTREWVEEGLRSGQLKSVVCTSSLDLGVDFSPVARVLQIGSPKGVARLLQRAGRSNHQPGSDSRVICVPTHAFELIEAAAAADAIAAGHLEGRQPHSKPLDVLVQHAVTIALGGGFEREALLQEVRQTCSYQSLTEAEWDWVLDFITRGGECLRAYPDFHKVVNDDGQHVVQNQRVARQHRMSIGTITGDAVLTVQFLKGPRLGTIEESFVARLKPGDHFTFAGRQLQFVSLHEMKVWVRKARSGQAGRIPRWMGGRMPLSIELAAAVRLKLDEARRGEFRGPEMEAVRPLLELQSAWSAIPAPNELLIERITSREGHHLFVFPFAGRLVHEGLSTLCAWRLSQRQPISFTMSVNDYGFELLSRDRAPLDEAIERGLLEPGGLDADLEHAMNAAEMGKRQFREIARVAGLVFDGYPGSRKSVKQLQASSGLLYDVFTNYDPGNLLLNQARREVLERQLEHSRMVQTLNELRNSRLVITHPARFTPLSFPLMVDRLRERLSSETLTDRIRRMQVQLEKAAG